LRRYLFIAAGGFAGAVLRYWIRSIETVWPGQIPATTLAVNLLGCFALGLILSLAGPGMRIGADIRLGIATGFLGALTTFATVCRELVAMLQNGHYLSAAFYGSASVLLGLAAVYSGSELACRWSAANRQEPHEYAEIPDEGENS
jgi:fluoride exporter